jgi:hypothetical protein
MTRVNTNFEIKAYLPLSTQNEIDRVSAKVAATRTTAEADFLTALAPYTTNQLVTVDSNTNLITEAAGNTVPTGYTGFKKGAKFTKLDAVGNGLYNNTGDETSAVWNLVDQADTADIPDGAVTAAKLAASLDMTSHALTNLKIQSGTPVNAVAATQTLTVTAGGTQIVDGYTVTIDTKTYTFKSALTPAEGEVLVGISDTASLLNLKNAINHTGTPDTDYKCAAVHPTVTGTSSNGTTLVVSAKVKGTAADSIATTSTGAEISWGAAHLASGVDGTVGQALQVLADSSYLYLATAANTVAVANWRILTVGSVY